MARKREQISKWLDALNHEKPESQHIAYVRTHPFGPHLSVDQYRLKNGLDILLLEDQSAPVVSFHAWFRVGSRHETPGKTGLAHLFEHLMFNEVEGLPAGAFDEKMEAVGADNNASTWLDFTQYQEAFPKQHLKTVIELEARRMHQLVLREPQLDSEKEVVKNERLYRVEDDVEGIVEELMWKTAFEQHPYHWPTIGWMKDIEGFEVADCEEFYRTYYSPNNAALVLVGALSTPNALRLIQKNYGPLPASEIPVEDIVPEPPQTGERRVSIQQPTATSKLALGYKGPALGDFDHVTVALLVEILAGSKGSILFQSLVRDQELASDVSGFVGPHKHPSLIEFSVSGRQAHTGQELLAAFDAQLELLKQKPVSASTLEQAVNKMELSSLCQLESADGKASSLGFYHTLLGEPGALFERIERARRTSPSDLLYSARRYFNHENRTVVIVSPQTDSLGLSVGSAEEAT